MEFGICLLGAVGVRERPDHRFEMVSQLLFGEMFEMLELRNGWYHIRMIHDSYQGWIPVNQAEPLEFEEYVALRNQPAMVTTELVSFIRNKEEQTSFPISAGCSVYPGIRGDIRLGSQVFRYDGQLINTAEPSLNNVTDYAMLFLNTPYLWGGRSYCGMDCSGFVQVVYKMAGIRIPRDTTIQASHGETIHLINETETGDLLFFDNQDGEINHVGILLQEGFIIHAHGKVRIDRIDHNGIFDARLKRYTHQLRLMKRMPLKQDKLLR